MLREKQEGCSILHMTCLRGRISPAVLVILKDGVAQLFACQRGPLIK